MIDFRAWLRRNTFLFWLGIVTPVGLVICFLLSYFVGRV